MSSFHQAARAGCPAQEAARTAFFHVAAQRHLQINALTRQILLESRTDNAFVAQQHALDSRQVHVNERIALVDIEGAGSALRYLPPYSPDFNPIEQVFSKLKTLLRSAQARTLEALWSAIGSLLDRFPPDECERYIRHCGYCQPG